MTCPHCLSTSISKRQHRTSLGYRTFSCRACRLRFNQRTASRSRQIFSSRWSTLMAELVA